jgi:hypothetical protein
MYMRQLNAIGLALGCSISALAFGQAANPAKPPAAPAKPAAAPAKEEPSALLKSSDAATKKRGAQMMLAQLSADAAKFNAQQVQKWHGELRAAGLTDEAQRLLENAAELSLMRDARVEANIACLRGTVLLPTDKKAAGFAMIREALLKCPAASAEALDQLKVADALISAGYPADAAKLFHQLTLESLADLGAIERLQTARIRCLLAANQNAEALAAAKSLYNVASMPGTASALTLVAKSLQANNPTDRVILEKFREEQVAGARTEGNRQEARGNSGKSDAATQRRRDEGQKSEAEIQNPNPEIKNELASSSVSSVVSSSVLTSIKIDPSLYAGRLPQEVAPMPLEEDFAKLTTTGNLLLLADQPQNARLWFEQAYRVCNERQLAAATESLARVMKAEDGTIGRANAWLLSLRPIKAEAKKPA